MPIQTATFTAQMEIRQGKRRREGGRDGDGYKKEKTGKGKGGNGGKGARDGLCPTEGKQIDKAGKAPFHLSNYIYLSLAHKQTKETNRPG